MSTLGALICEALSSGIKIPRIGKLYQGKQIKPILKSVRLPPLIGMIIMGLIARNFFGPIMDAYPKVWA